MFKWHQDSRLKEDFEEKIVECIDSLYNIALHMAQNKQDAQDLVQEAALRAYRNFGKFRPGTNFKAWVITILRNTFINEYRKRRKEPPMADFEKVKDFISLPEISGAQEEIFSERIRSLIDKLPEKLRTTIMLFYAEGFSYKEVAKIMDVPVGTVMSRLWTARQTLKEEVCSYGSRERERDNGLRRD